MNSVKYLENMWLYCLNRYWLVVAVLNRFGELCRCIYSTGIDDIPGPNRKIYFTQIFQGFTVCATWNRFQLALLNGKNLHRRTAQCVPCLCSMKLHKFVSVSSVSAKSAFNKLLGEFGGGNFLDKLINFSTTIVPVTPSNNKRYHGNCRQSYNCYSIVMVIVSIFFSQNSAF